MFHKKIEFQENTGLYLNFHAIVALAIDTRTKIITIVVGHFMHQSDYDAYKAPIATTVHQVSSDNFNKFFNDVNLQAVEEYIKVMSKTSPEYIYATE